MSNLFESTEINGMRLANRFVRSATWEGMAADDGFDFVEGGGELVLSFGIVHGFKVLEGRDLRCVARH